MKDANLSSKYSFQLKHLIVQKPKVFYRSGILGCHSFTFVSLIMGKIKGKKSMGIDEVIRAVGTVGQLPPTPPDFDRYINPFIRADRLCPPHYCSPPSPRIFRTSYDPGEERKEEKQGENFFRDQGVLRSSNDQRHQKDKTLWFYVCWKLKWKSEVFSRELIPCPSIFFGKVQIGFDRSKINFQHGLLF